MTLGATAPDVDDAPRIKVLVKAMSILNLIASQPDVQMGLGEIASQLKLNRSTCHHILDTLASGGYVERPSPGQYRLGITLFQVGSRLKDRLDVRERTYPTLVETQRLSGETVFLYIRRGDEAVCVERIDGRYAGTHLMQVGSALPLHIGAAPKVFLAADSDGDVESYIRRASGLPNHRFPLDSPQLWRDIADFRATGTVSAARDIEANTRAVGAAVRDYSGSVVAAVSISWVEALSEHSEEQMRVQIRAAADTISASLGYQPDGEAVAYAR
ncbi:IclR family transcriptional regulator [Microbacterium sp.]|uniref:IclR family transcriptional regulator n=1 Tax=Microbacterium sp. TaxID=51671 RepID=UPI003A94C6E5